MKHLKGRIANRLIFVLAFVLAGISLSTRWTILPFSDGTFFFVTVSTILSAAWLLCVAISMCCSDKKDPWIIAGAPLVMFWPIWFLLFLLSCKFGAECS